MPTLFSSVHGGSLSKKELYKQVRVNPAIFDFLQAGSLDGIWYWDLENQEDEWMSPRFWEIFGYDFQSKQHKASEWQNMINQEDLKLCIDNFEKHLADPSHPYDQIVRYTHKDGHTVWIRCRGIIIRDDSGKAIRMLGAHTDVTQLMEAELQLKKKIAELERTNQLMIDREIKMKELKKENDLLKNKLTSQQSL